MHLIKKLFVTLALTLTATMANAFDKEPFTEERFNELQAAGHPVLVDVYATWCPTCKKQQKRLTKYFEMNPDSAIKVLVVDYDGQPEWVKHFKAPRQSTLLLYKNGEQQWFSVAETREKKIFAALTAAEK